MGRTAVKVAAVDIGTNTVRVLLADAVGELERSEFVTGLGTGVDTSGRLSDEAIARTLAALERIAPRIGQASAIRIAATSASRDADNRDSFFDRVEQVVGQRPDLLSGDEEAALSFSGATSTAPAGLSTVVDLGGGSTEIITGFTEPIFARSFDIGSVRITDRHFDTRPVPPGHVELARLDIRSAITEAPDSTGTVIGVGGTFQTLGLMLAASNHSVSLDRSELDDLVVRLAQLTIRETAAWRGVTRGRERVILGGALVAATVLSLLGTNEVSVSRHDLLDGMVAQLLAQSHPG